MICPKCGAPLPDNSTFCTNCGTSIAQAAPMYAPAQPMYSAPAPGGAGLVYKTLKGIAASPLFLIAAIALTVTLVLGIIGSLSSTGSVGDFIGETLSEYSDQLDISSSDMREIRRLLNDVPDVDASTVVVGQIPQILICAGVWMLFASALSNSGRMSAAGLTIIKVINIISLVFLCIFLGIALIGLIIAMAAAGDAAALLALLIVPLIIASVLVIIYFSKLIKTINTMKSVVNTGAPSDRVSPFVAVVCIIGGASSAFSVIRSLSYGALLSALADVANAAALICFGLLIFNFRNRMQELMRMAPVGGFAPASYVGSSYPQYQTPVNPYGAPVTVCPNCRAQHAATDAVCPFCGYSSNPR